jgi:uncharacterized membrane protein YeaQ/YmgE (transglycosylase-associated protein family)
MIAGWLAERITGRNHGLVMNLLVGLIGAFIGGFIATSVIGFHYAQGFNLATLAVATAGAVLFLAVFGGIRSSRDRGAI